MVKVPIAPKGQKVFTNRVYGKHMKGGAYPFAFLAFPKAISNRHLQVGELRHTGVKCHLGHTTTTRMRVMSSHVCRI